MPNSKTRRGRVGEQKAQTLDTQCNQAVVVGAEMLHGGQITPTLRTGGGMSMSKKHSYDIIKVTNSAQVVANLNSSQDGKVFSIEGIFQTLSSGHSNIPKILTEKTNIRRLTEIEAERLQGFKDNWTEYGNYDGVIKKISRTQRYKMIGNAITVDIVELIAKKLLVTLTNNNL